MQAYASFVQCLREPIRPDRVLKAPSFSHADKDPVDDGIAVHPHHRLVIIEGAYCNVDEAPWSKAAELLDERWLVEADELECRQRLIKRHLSAGICVDEADAIKRGQCPRSSEQHVKSRLTLRQFLQSRQMICQTDNTSWRTSLSRSRGCPTVLLWPAGRESGRQRDDLGALSVSQSLLVPFSLSSSSSSTTLSRPKHWLRMA